MLSLALSFFALIFVAIKTKRNRNLLKSVLDFEGLMDYLAASY